MADKVKIGVVGLGKMGLSHLSMVNAHPDAETIACDATGFLVDVLSKNMTNKFYGDFDDMLAKENLDAVLIATPSRLHGPMVRTALDKGISVFCEKPFCLDWEQSLELAQLAEDKKLVNQVGYHYRYVGAFQKMKEVLDAGAIGTVTHVLAEAYGPVVLRPKKQSWRTTKSEGGGCLYDYAAHPLNLLNWFFGEASHVSGSHLISIFSEGTDDEVFSTLQFKDGPTAQLSVNWSDESHRKMSTKVSLIGTKGRIVADRQECQIYLREPCDAMPDLEVGWNVKYTTELTEDPWFYLRGEEYSWQIDDFISAVRDGAGAAKKNDFRSAALTDKAIAMIVENSETGQSVGTPSAYKPEPAPKKRGWFRN